MDHPPEEGPPPAKGPRLDALADRGSGRAGSRVRMESALPAGLRFKDRSPASMTVDGLDYPVRGISPVLPSRDLGPWGEVRAGWGEALKRPGKRPRKREGRGFLAGMPWNTLGFGGREGERLEPFA